MSVDYSKKTLYLCTRKPKKINNMLKLPLKTKWYQLIEDGIKTEEYRDINAYYCARLCAKYDKSLFTCRHCETSLCQPLPKVDKITFTLGYPKNDDNERNMTRYVLDIVKGHGIPDLGGDLAKNQFKIILSKFNPDSHE